MLRRLSWLRPLLGLLGFGAFVFGAVGLFTIDNSAGSLFLITVGIVLVLVAFLGTRIQLESFEIMGAKIRVNEVVRSRLQLAQRSGTSEGDSREGLLREQALVLQTLLGLYDLYEYVRRTQPFSERRTDNLDQLALRMQAAGREVQFDPVDVSTWFHQGDDALRVVALNLMHARQECRDFLAVLETVDEPHSNFEQYYGLWLGQKMLPTLDPLERQLFGDAISRAQGKRRFRRDQPLMRRSKAILSELNP
jgi:hypothetical protein